MNKKDESKTIENVKKRNCQYVQGSFTIEASFVILVILFIVIFIIYLSVFLYGKVVFTNASYIAAFRGTQKLSEGTDEVYEVVKKTSDEKINFPFWVFDECNEKADINARNITVYYSAKSDMKLLEFVSFLEKEKWSMEISGSAKYTNAVIFIRNCRRVESLNDGRVEQDDP